MYFGIWIMQCFGGKEKFLEYSVYISFLWEITDMAKTIFFLITIFISVALVIGAEILTQRL